MTKGYSIFEWILGIPITDKDNNTQSEENERSSAHETNHDYDTTENG